MRIAGGGGARPDRGDAVPDVLARGDLGAAGRLRALRAARPAARAADRRCRRRASRRRSRSRSPTAPSCSRAPTTTPPPRPRARAATSRWWCSPVRVAAAALRAAALPLDTRLEAIRIAPERLRLLRVGVAGGLVVALGLGALVADAPRRISDARATFSEGRYMDYSSDLRTRLTSAVDNGRIDNWRVALDGFDEQPLHGTGAGTYRITLGPRAGRRRRSRSTTATRCTSRRCRSSGWSGSCCCWSRSARSWAPAWCGSAGPSATPTARSWRRATMLALHAAIDWDWEMPALFVWLFGAGGVALAARAGTAARRPAAAARHAAATTAGVRRRALAVLVLAITPALFALLAAAAGSRRHGLRAARLPDGDRRGADRHRALRHAPRAVADPRLLRRAAGAVRARPARDGRRPLARSRTTGSSPTARRSSTASRASTRGPTPPRRCG